MHRTLRVLGVNAVVLALFWCLGFAVVRGTLGRCGNELKAA